MKKRVICLFLCVMLLIPLLPTVALADEEPTVTICWYLDVNDELPVAGLEVPYGEPYTEDIAEPGREGEYFLGWFYDKACTQPFDRDMPVMEDINLYPLWVKQGEELPVDSVWLSTTWAVNPGESIHDFLYDYLFAEARSHCTVKTDPVLTNGTYFYDKTEKKAVNDGEFLPGHTYALSAVLEPRDGYRLDADAVYYFQAGDDYYLGSVSSVSPFRVEYTLDDAHKVETVICAIYLDKDDTMMTAGWTIPKGTAVSGIATPARMDDYFGGWYKDKSFTEPFNPQEPLYADTNFYARWIPKDYVTINIYPTDYADTPFSRIRIPRGTVYGEIEHTSRDDGKFGGWFLDPSCTEPYDPTARLDTSIDVFERWSREYPIELITLTSLAPDAGTAAGNLLGSLVMTFNRGCTVQSAYWYDNYAEKQMDSDDRFTETGFYSLYVTFAPEFDYILSPAFAPTTYLTIHDHTYRGTLMQKTSSDDLFTVEFPITPNNVAPTLHLRAYLNPAIDQYSVEWFIPEGTSTEAPFPPTREGYTFGGWYFDKECTVPFDASLNLFEDTDVYAGWDEIVVDFEDVTNKSDWSYAGIEYCVKHGYMNGFSATRFNPKGTVTRAQLVTILYRMAGSPAVEYRPVFDDVKPGQWYSDAIIWAAENGIVNGISKTRFDPMGDITREQIATILYRYVGSPELPFDLAQFPDANKVSDYARSAMVWATRQGLINGIKTKTATLLSPRSYATREQIASIIMRYDQA